MRRGGAPSAGVVPNGVVRNGAVRNGVVRNGVVRNGAVLHEVVLNVWRGEHRMPQVHDRQGGSAVRRFCGSRLFTHPPRRSLQDMW
jgi:hypothetical protein